MESPQNDPDTTKNSSKASCLYCNYENEVGNQFCIKCGNSLLYKLCTVCNCTNLMRAKFCSGCGTDLASGNTISVKNSNVTIPTQQPINPGNYPYYYYPRPPEPKWWKLPVFFIIFCIFGLQIFSLVAYGIGAAIIFGTSFTNLSNFESVIFSNMGLEIVQLLLIVSSLKIFKGFSNFFNENKGEQSQPKQNGLKIEKTKDFRKITNIFRAILWIILFASIILIIDEYGSMIIEYLKDFLNLGPTSSSYAFMDNNIQQYFLLITFVDVIFAPIYEEIVFRGILQQALNKTATSDFSHYLIQGTIFSLAHLVGDIGNGGSIDFIVAHMIFTFTLAICLTFLRKKYNSLLPCFALHGLLNSISVFGEILGPPFFTVEQVNLISTLFYVLPIIAILVIIPILYQFDGWRLHKPMIFKSKSQFLFSAQVIFFALVVDFLEFILVLLPYDLALNYLLGVIIGSPILLVLWGRKIVDVSWNQIQNVRKSKKGIIIS